MRRRLARRTPALSILLLLSHAVAPTRAVAQEEPAPPPSPAEQAAEAVTLSLRDALEGALENNLDIAVRRYDPLKSEALVTLQESLFDPLLTSAASSDQSQDRQIFFRQADLTDRNHDFRIGFEDPLAIGGSYKFDLTASDTVSTIGGAVTDSTFFTSWRVTFIQPLLRRMGPDANRWQILVARNNLGISEARFRQTVLDTLSASEKAYWDLNFALMDLRTKRASLQLAKDFLEQNRIKVRVGTLAPIEITQAEAGVADREEGVILAENAVRTAEDALRRIMNVPHDSPMWSRPIQPSDAPPLVETAPGIDAAVAAAQTNRPDLEQARLDVRSRETELHYRRNQRRWGLDFQGAYGTLGFGAEVFEETCVSLEPDTGECLRSVPTGNILSHGSYGDALEDLRDRNKVNWVLGLNLSVPIGNRQAAANYSNAEHALSQSRYDLQRLEQAARVEVRIAVRTVETNLKRVKAAQVNVRLQREKLAAEQKKFQNGMSTSFQVLQFQTDLTTAESRENQAIVDYNKSLVELERAKGTLLEARNMILPGAAGEGARSPASGEPSGVLRGRFTLPEEFVFDGRRLVGRAGAAR